MKIRQVDSGNAYADFNIGFGSTAGGLDYGSTAVRLGKDNNGTKIAVISTSDALIVLSILHLKIPATIQQVLVAIR